MIEVTSLFVHYVTVVNASRDGARYGSKSSTDAEIRSVTQNDLARFPGAITPTADIKIDHTPAVSGDNTVAVTACYNHHLLMHITLVLPDVVRVCETTTMRIHSDAQSLGFREGPRDEKPKEQETERGQVLPLLALLTVALMGIDRPRSRPRPHLHREGAAQ